MSGSSSMAYIGLVVANYYSSSQAYTVTQRVWQVFRVCGGILLATYIMAIGEVFLQAGSCMYILLYINIHNDHVYMPLISTYLHTQTNSRLELYHHQALAYRHIELNVSSIRVSPQTKQELEYTGIICIFSKSHTPEVA